MSGVHFSPTFSGLFFHCIYSYFSFSLEYYTVLGIDRRSMTKGLMYRFFVLVYWFAILSLVFSILLLRGIFCRPVFLDFYVKLLNSYSNFSCLVLQATFSNTKNHLLTKGLSNFSMWSGQVPLWLWTLSSAPVCPELLFFLLRLLSRRDYRCVSPGLEVPTRFWTMKWWKSKSIQSSACLRFSTLLSQASDCGIFSLRMLGSHRATSRPATSYWIETTSNTIVFWAASVFGHRHSISYRQELAQHVIMKQTLH